MNRKEVLKTSVLLGTTLAAVKLFGQEKEAKETEKEEDHSEHDHGAGGKNTVLMKTASDCIGKGQVCITHCLELLASGEKGMLGCAKAVQDMLAACTGLVAIAGHNSKHLKKYAAACIDICKDCMKECNKHAKKHKECKECGAACKACIKELEKV